MALVMVLLSAFCFAGCSKDQAEGEKIPELPGLEYESTTPLKYANQFAIHKFKGGYSYIDIVNGTKVLVVPEGKEVPEGLADDVTVVKQPVSSLYMAATSSMSLIGAMEAYDKVGFSCLEKGKWNLEGVNQLMEEGKILYAGKYSAPDYETLLEKGCNLAIESTMIYHTPEVSEKLQELGISVIVEHSSYENHPLGRTEWIKVYGAILGREKEAEAAFEKEDAMLSDMKVAAAGSEGQNVDGGQKKVAFFYINSMGNVVTYKSDGYAAAMIQLAGGSYVPAGITGDNKLSTLNMSMEDFYAAAADADVLIYNSSIVNELQTLDQLRELSAVLGEFKAVKSGEVWCTSKSMFQQTDKMGSIIKEMNAIISGENQQELKYMHKLH